MSLRHIEIPADDWQSQDTAAVHNTLADVCANPAVARAWRGSIALKFADTDKLEERHPYTNPAIAGFLHRVYAELPYLLYFLNPERENGALDTFFASIGALCQTNEAAWVMWSDDVGAAYYAALTAAAEFAVKSGDDWVAVVRGYEQRSSIFDEIREVLVARGVLLA